MIKYSEGKGIKFVWFVLVVIIVFLERREDKSFFSTVLAAGMRDQDKCVGGLWASSRGLLQWHKSDVDGGQRQHIFKNVFQTCCISGSEQ